jgi:hypothetical protein
MDEPRRGEGLQNTGFSIKDLMPVACCLDPLEAHFFRETLYGPVPDFQRSLSNPELPGALDLALLELETRLFRYAKIGPELLEMADEGLVLAARAKARPGQSLSAAQHTEGHLQVVGMGEWHPTSTRAAWNAEPRLPDSEEGSSQRSQLGCRAGNCPIHWSA